jgi:hypothetical protein
MSTKELSCSVDGSKTMKAPVNPSKVANHNCMVTFSLRKTLASIRTNIGIVKVSRVAVAIGVILRPIIQTVIAQKSITPRAMWTAGREVTNADRP